MFCLVRCTSNICVVTYLCKMHNVFGDKAATAVLKTR